MPQHQNSRDRIFRELARVTDPRFVEAVGRVDVRRLADQLLDQYLQYENQATEWDAAQWGLDPDGWMRHERQAMVQLAGGQLYPTEPCMRRTDAPT